MATKRVKVTIAFYHDVDLDDVRSAAEEEGDVAEDETMSDEAALDYFTEGLVQDDAACVELVQEHHPNRDFMIDVEET